MKDIHTVIETKYASQIIDTANITVFFRDGDKIHYEAEDLPDILAETISRTVPVSYLILRVHAFIENDKIVLNVLAWDGVCTGDWINYFDPESGELVKSYLKENSLN